MSLSSSSVGLTNSLVQQQLAAAKRTAFRSAGRETKRSADITPSAFNIQAAALHAAADGKGEARTVLRADKIASLIKTARATAQQALNTTATVARVTGSVAKLQPTERIDLAANTLVTVSDGHTTANYTHRLGNTVQDFIDAVNNTANLNIKASLTTGGRLQFAATDANSIAINGSADEAALATLGLETGTTTSKIETARSSVARRFDAVRDEIDAVDLELGGSRITAAGLGIAPAGAAFQSDAAVASTVGDLDRAAKRLTEGTTPLRSAEKARVEADLSRTASSLLPPGDTAILSSDRSDRAIQTLAAETRAHLARSSRGIATSAGINILRLFA